MSHALQQNLNGDDQYHQKPSLFGCFDTLYAYVGKLFSRLNAVENHVSEMELQLQTSLASTYNGSFMWRIDP